MQSRVFVLALDMDTCQTPGTSSIKVWFMIRSYVYN